MMTGLGLLLVALGGGVMYSAVKDITPTEAVKALIRATDPGPRGTVTSELDTEAVNKAEGVTKISGAVTAAAGNL